MFISYGIRIGVYFFGLFESDGPWVFGFVDDNLHVIDIGEWNLFDICDIVMQGNIFVLRQGSSFDEWLCE
jgi:hypothetical protein